MSDLVVSYKPSFLREFKKLERALQHEAKEKIELFKNPANHKKLRVHYLKGPLAPRMSFSVNYRYRIVFEWEEEGRSAVLLAIGDHEVYR